MTDTDREPSGSINWYLEEFVALPRRQFGEAVGLRHSMIMLLACLSCWHPERPDSNKALLAALQTVRDLAAQLNDTFMEGKVLGILQETVAPALPSRDRYARRTCTWLSNLCRSQIIAHGRGFTPGSAEMEMAYMYAGRAAPYVEDRDPSQDLAQKWQSLQLSLPSVALYGAMMAIAAGRPQAFVDRFLARHARAAVELGMRAPPGDLSTPASSGDVHWDDFLISVFLHRPFSQANFDGPSAHDPDWFRFDPEKAKILARAAIAESAPRDTETKTVRASLFLSLTEAILCERSREGWGSGIVWDDEARSEYAEARNETVKRFRDLHMHAKLKKIAGLELRAGVDAKKWGLPPIGRNAQPVAVSVSPTP